MKHIRIISYCLIFTLLIPLIPTYVLPVSASVSDEVVIAELSEKNFIDKTGLVSSTLYKKSGSFSSLWGGTNIHNEITIPVKNVNLLDTGYIEFWVYNANVTNMEFAFVLMADNPDTSVTDYYYSTIKTSWNGWRKLSYYIRNTEQSSAVLSDASVDPTAGMSWAEYDNYIDATGGIKVADTTSSFLKSGSPLGIKHLTSVKLWPSFAGSKAVDGTNVYFDNIVFKLNQSSDAFSDSNSDEQNNKLVLVDFTNPSLVAQKGYEYSTEHSEDGLGAAKIYGDLLEKSSTYTPSTGDWSKYNRLNFEMYSEKITNSGFSIGVVQENPDTSGEDYYKGVISLDWEGSWQKISFTYDHQSGTTNLEKSRTPLGFDQVNKISLWFTFSNAKMSEDTVFYIKRIYLDVKEEEKNVVLDNSVDYIPNHEPRYLARNLEDGMKKTIERREHPRLLCTTEQWERNLELYRNNDPYLVKTVNNVIKEADTYLNIGDSEYELYDGQRLVRNERFAIKYCAFAFAVTGEQKYFDRMYRAIEVASAWPDWNPSHWLDVAEMAYAFAVAYDLCYDSFTETQRRVLRNGLMKNGIEQGCKTWRANGSVPRVNTNWQEVCAGGAGMAALVLIDEPGYYNICAEFVNHAIRTLPTGLKMYGPDGAFPEGLAYWEYASKFFFNFDKALFNTVGTDFGLSDMDGLSETGFFPIISVGPVNQFNYSDSNESKSKVSDACMYYLAERYNKKSLATYHYQTGLNTGEFEDFLSYRDYLIEDVDYKTITPLDAHYRGEQDVVYATSSMNDDAIWLAFKGGANYANHGCLDKGSFVFDSQGIRWIFDPGAGEYNTTGYWERKSGGGRWKLYKKRAEGHSTIVINPADKTNEDQIVDAYAAITDYKTSDSGVYGLIDLTEVYADDVNKATRGIALTNNRSEVVVQDEIISDSPVELYSFFPTKQNIELTDNPKVAYMYSESGKRIRLDITSPANAKWEVMKNVSLPTSPVHEQNTATGNGVAGEKLYVHLTNAVNPTVSVTIRNVYDGIEEANPSGCIPHSQWDSYLEEKASVDMLYIDGIPVNGFSKNCSSYMLNGAVGILSADFNEEKVSVEYKQGEKLGDTAYCKVTNKLTGDVSYYFVSFSEVYIDIDPASLEKINILSAEASAVPEPLNVPENTFDGDITNRWAAENEAWIIWELDSVQKIEQILLSFWKGSVRATKFDIYVSKDKNNWELAFSGKAAGNTDALELFKLNDTYDAKYVKYYGFGNDQNGWNSIQEVYIPKVMEAYTDTVSHWAKDDINQVRLLNIVKGKTAMEFDPESDVTVAEFISMVVRCLGMGETEYKGVYSDVSANDWYSNNVQTAYSEGLLPEVIIKDGRLNPDKAITREEMATILSVAYKKYYTKSLVKINLKKYIDYNDMSPELYSYISDSIAARFIKGRTADLYAPKATATRAEAATILKRLYIAKITSPANSITA